MRRTMLLRAATGAALLSALAAPAGAVPSTEYRGCDGYGAPSDEGDGMTEYARVLGIFSPSGYGTTARTQTETGSAGVAACDQALTDVPEQHWMRRVSLLRARAIHHLEANDAPSALADLDLAQAAVKDASEPYYARSLGWGMDVVRAFALRMTGDHAKAETLAMNALGQRPYNRQTLVSADLALLLTASPRDEDTIMHGIARLVPAERARLFTKALYARDYAGAIALYPYLAPSRDMSNYGNSRNGQATRELRDQQTASMFWASASGNYAYALAILGRDADARAIIDQAHTKLVADTQPPPPVFDPNDKDEAARNMLTTTFHAKTSAAAMPILDAWSQLAQYRMQLNEGQADAVRKAVADKPLPHNWAATELIAALAKSLVKPPAKGAKPKIAPIMNQTVNAITQVSPAPDSQAMSALFKTLPEAESPGRMPPYEEAKKPWFAFTGSRDDMDTQGWRVHDDDGVTMVGFRGVRSTASVVEEMALLRAAELARAAGKTGFIVKSRFDTQYSVNTTYYGQTLRTDPDGFQTELGIVFIDLANPPADFANASWLAFNADDVYNALAPVYLVKRDEKKKEPT